MLLTQLIIIKFLLIFVTRRFCLIYFWYPLVCMCLNVSLLTKIFALPGATFYLMESQCSFLCHINTNVLVLFFLFVLQYFFYLLSQRKKKRKSLTMLFAEQLATFASAFREKLSHFLWYVMKDICGAFMGAGACVS